MCVIEPRPLCYHSEQFPSHRCICFKGDSQVLCVRIKKVSISQRAVEHEAKSRGPLSVQRTFAAEQSSQCTNSHFDVLLVAPSVAAAATLISVTQSCYS